MLNSVTDRLQEARSKRGPAQLKDSLARRLSSYASAAGGASQDALKKSTSSGWMVAGVTGIGILALSVPANAGIVKGNNFSCCILGPGTATNRNFGTALWDVNGKGVADFQGFGRATTGAAGMFYFDDGGSIRGLGPGAGFLHGPLGKGYQVGSKGAFSPVGAVATGVQLYKNLMVAGSWANPNARINNTGGCSSCETVGYLGFEFEIDGQIHYGWATLSVGDTGHNYSANLGPVYYDTVANQPIATGETQVVPEPGTLGLLALGALGLGLWRRRRQLGPAERP